MLGLARACSGHRWPPPALDGTCAGPSPSWCSVLARSPGLLPAPPAAALALSSPLHLLGCLAPPAQSSIWSSVPAGGRAGSAEACGLRPWRLVLSPCCPSGSSLQDSPLRGAGSWEAPARGQEAVAPGPGSSPSLGSSRGLRDGQGCVRRSVWGCGAGRPGRAWLGAEPPPRAVIKAAVPELSGVRWRHVSLCPSAAGHRAPWWTGQLLELGRQDWTKGPQLGTGRLPTCVGACPQLTARAPAPCAGAPSVWTLELALSSTSQLTGLRWSPPTVAAALRHAARPASGPQDAVEPGICRPRSSPRGPPSVPSWGVGRAEVADVPARQTTAATALASGREDRLP